MSPAVVLVLLLSGCSLLPVPLRLPRDDARGGTTLFSPVAALLVLLLIGRCCLS